MGSLVGERPTHTTSDLLLSYLELIGREGDVELNSLPLDCDFDEARRHVDSVLGISSIAPLDHDECLLEWRGERCEGRCEARGSTSFFAPDVAANLPAPGTEARLRFEGGSQRVLVLAQAGSGLVIARAPHRQERRVNKRAAAGGFAVVRVGGLERTVSLADISEGGVGLTSELIIEAGEHIDLLLRIEGSKPLAFECEGLLVNCRKPSEDSLGWLGVQFTKLPEGARDDIRRYVREEPGS